MSDLSRGFDFSITPAGDAWRWATFSLTGERRSAGLAATRAIAAAFVIRDICQAQTPPRPDACVPSAKAA